MQVYDLVIVGGGPSGLTAGLYAARAKLDCLLLERLIPGGQILSTYWIENWPGDVHGVSSLNLADRLRDHALKFGLVIKKIEVFGLRVNTKVKIITTSEGEIITKALILALGARPRTLDLPGEKELTGKGVSYCATCDAPFFRGQSVVVFGGGNAAAEEAIYLTKFADKVYMVHRREELKACSILFERVKSNPKIEMLLSHVGLSIEGDQEVGVKAVQLKNLKNNQNNILSVSGAFIFIGITPNTAFLKKILDLDENGFIKTDINLQTNIPGIFASGDCRTSLLRQIVVAAGDGAVAAYAAQRYLENYFV